MSKSELKRTNVQKGLPMDTPEAKYTQPIASNQINAESVMNLLQEQEPLGAEFSKILHENLWDLYEKDNSTNSAAQPTTRIKAKPLVWEEEGHGTDWYDAKCDFHICLEALSYEAAWGEGDPESFATLDEAKQWCQVQIEDWINELAIAPQEVVNIEKNTKQNVLFSDAPNKIYLTVGDADENELRECNWQDLAEICWCTDKIDKYDIEYIRADLVIHDQVIENEKPKHNLYKDGDANIPDFILLKRVANIAHLGGLRNLSESAALKEIRKLTENYWDKSATRIISNRG